MPTLHNRKIGNVVYTGGGRQTLELDRDGILLDLDLRLRFTVTNAVTGPVGPLFQTLARLFKRIEIIAGGRDTVWSVNGVDLAARIQYEESAVAYGMDDTVVLTNSAVTTYDVVLPMSFTLPRARRPDDTGLDTRGLSTLTLAITWGGIEDLFATPNNAVISDVTCSVEGNHLLDVPDEQAYLVRAVDTVERELTGTSDNFDIIMDRGTGLLYRSFLIATVADSVGVNTILDPGSIRLEAGSFIYQNRSGVHVRAMNRTRYSQQTPGLIDGVYFIPVTFAGQLTTAIDTSNLGSDLKLILDAVKVSGSNFIRVNREAVRPLKVA